MTIDHTMTIERIIDGVVLLAEQLAKGDTHRPDDWDEYEWAFIKGSATFALLHWIDRVIDSRKPK